MSTRSPRAKPKNVSEYIAAAPREVRAKLRQMRACVRATAPQASESLKWGMPSVSYDRILVTYAAFKQHIGFYPTPSALKAFAKDIAKFKNAKGSVQFPLDRPLPLALVKRIVKFRVQECRERDAKWRTVRS